MDRKQERSTALNPTWAWKRRKETFPAVPCFHRTLSRGHSSSAAAHLPFCMMWAPNPSFTSPNEPLVHGILWLLGSILCILCWYKRNINVIWEGTQRAEGSPWRILGKNLHSKSTLSSVLLQDTVIKINPQAWGPLASDLCLWISAQE